MLDSLGGSRAGGTCWLLLRSPSRPSCAASRSSRCRGVSFLRSSGSLSTEQPPPPWLLCALLWASGLRNGAAPLLLVGDRYGRFSWLCSFARVRFKRWLRCYPSRLLGGRLRGFSLA